jgi:hypothetical protein
MFTFEYEELFKEVYAKAEEQNPEIKDVVIVVNTHCPEGVSVGKGVDENQGQYRISCHGDDADPSYTISSFALGLAMVIYDIKYGEYDYMTMTEEERNRFDSMFHAFFPNSENMENIIVHSEENNG